MGLLFAAGVMSLQLAAAPVPAPPLSGAPEVAEDWAAQERPSQAAIVEAVRATLAEQKVSDTRKPLPEETVVLRSAKYEQFAATFSEAAVPGCLRPDGLKRQPTGWGVFQLTGLLQAPFVLVAKLRGKCR